MTDFYNSFNVHLSGKVHRFISIFHKNVSPILLSNGLVTAKRERLIACKCFKKA